MELSEQVIEQLGWEQQHQRVEVRTRFLTLPHLLTNFKMQRCQNEPKFNGAHSRNNMPVVKTREAQIKDGVYVVNLEDYKSIGTHWMV